jgi:hypothetical protein
MSVGWLNRWFRIYDSNFGDDFTLPLDTPIAALSRVQSHLDLFAVGKDTSVCSTFYDDNGGWTDHWFRIADPNFGDGFTLPLNTPIAALSRVPGHIDLFAVGKDTAVYSTFWDQNGGWNGHWFRIADPNFGDGFTLPLNTPIAALSRVPGHIDLFAVGKDTSVCSTFWDENGGWHGHWFRIADPNFGDGFTLPLNTPIAALPRGPGHIDLVAVGKDTAVYTTYWGDVPGRPVMAGDVATFDSGPLTTGLPLGGSVRVVLRSNGDFTFSSHAHDSGLDNIDYVVSVAIVTSDGINAYEIQHSGSIQGTVGGIPPHRNDDFTQGGNNQQIAREWAGITNAVLVANLRGTDQLVGGLEGALKSALEEALAELGKAAVSAVIKLI